MVLHAHITWEMGNWPIGDRSSEMYFLPFDIIIIIFSVSNANVGCAYFKFLLHGVPDFSCISSDLPETKSFENSCFRLFQMCICTHVLRKCKWMFGLRLSVDMFNQINMYALMA
jgi:hypothetical protein